MDVLTLIIAVVALVVACAAYVRSGGVQDLRRQIQTVGLNTESARQRTADAVSRLEQLIRGRDKREPEDPDKQGGAPPEAS
jgi:cell division protein FtsL